MLSWYSQPEVRAEFDHIWNAPFSPCLPFLPPLSMKIIGYKTSAESHSSPPTAPSRSRRSSSHDKTPLYLLNGALNVVDGGRLFSSLFYNSCGCNFHWPRPLLDFSLNVSFRCVKSQLSIFCSILLSLKRRDKKEKPLHLTINTPRVAFTLVTTISLLSFSNLFFLTPDEEL